MHIKLAISECNSGWILYTNSDCQKSQSKSMQIKFYYRKKKEDEEIKFKEGLEEAQQKIEIERAQEQKIVKEHY